MLKKAIFIRKLGSNETFLVFFIQLSIVLLVNDMYKNIKQFGIGLRGKKMALKTKNKKK